MLLASALKETAQAERSRAAWPSRPYVGLNYFSREDAPLFGQRDVDTSNCAAIVGLATNKVFLLHGRSGAGKSSFLRAGLLPRLEESRYWCLETPNSEGEPFLTRCTGDPLEKLQETLILHLDGPAELEFLAEDSRRQVIEILESGASENGASKADVLLAALSIMSRGLTRPAVLTIDQSEEIFTVCSDVAARRAFFYFLEELCLWNLDVKLIVALRTEYYGQFCDELRIDPNLRVSTSHTSLNQYMLHGLRSRDQLVAAIKRPTVREAIDPYGVPFEAYGFEFDSGVAERIAEDLLQHCGESSTLPVMQIVCQALHYSVVVERSQRRISMAHYTRLGRVEGQVNAFIQSSITKALRELRGYQPTAGEITRWQEVLAELVARQEGGVLTTLLVDEKALVEIAEKHGIRHQADICLITMASEPCRLLRVVKRTDPVSSQVQRQFSLAHDSLAPTLFQWRESRGDLLRERKRTRNSFLVAGAAVVICVLFFVGILWQRYIISASLINLYSTIVEGDATPNFRTKILLSLAALSRSEGPLASYLGHEAQEEKIRKLLVRVPAIVGRSALAVNTSADGHSIVRLDQDGKVVSQNLQTGSTRELGQIQIDSPSGWSSPPAIGFVEGLELPVVVYGNKIYWWPDGAAPSQRSVSVDQVLAGFEGGGWIWLEIAGGRIRAAQYLSQKRSYNFSDITFPDGTPRATEVRSLHWPRRMWPTFSPYSGQLAYINRDRELYVANRANTHLREIAQLDSNPTESFLAAIGFANVSDAIIVRNTRSSLGLFEGNPAVKHSFTIDSAFREASVRPRFGASRPLIAGVQTEAGWRFAWVAPDGIAVVQGQQRPGGASSPTSPVFAKPLLAAALLDSITRLEFSRDGNFLIAIVQPGFQDPRQYRVWNLSEEYTRGINKLEGSELVDKGCALALLEGSNRFTDVEATNWTASEQPCR